MSQTAPDGNGDDLDNEPDNDTGLIDESTDETNAVDRDEPDQY